MGNTAAKDALEEAETNRAIDLSNKLTPPQYDRHEQGEFLEGHLTAIPWEIYYNSVSMYESVNVSFNFISSVPEELSIHIPHLRHLDISHNQLVSLPESFHLLLHLQVLNLSYNRLKTLPLPLIKLKKLSSLNLSHNNIKDLPSSVSQWQNLKKLNISHNGLRALPNSMCECAKLKVIVTLSNDLIHPPQAICDEGSETTLAYLRERHEPTPEKPPPVTSIFVRCRGQQVVASVSNPESANVEYRQAQGTGRTNKRKCPLMPPADSSELSPDHLTDVLLGLVYGAVISDAMALNTEGLSRDECLFFYELNNFTLKDRIKDRLRSNFPVNDWSSNSDMMLLTLESLMRWGGVVDELEFATQLDQWRIHGFVDIDSVPGYALSPLLDQVIKFDGFSTNPHAAAENLYKQVKSEQSQNIGSINTSDNSCLPPALVLGIPNFYKENEVIMNAERISKSTHADPLSTAASVLISLLVAELLQGKMLSEGLDATAILHEALKKSSTIIKEEKLQQKYLDLLSNPYTSNGSNCVSTTICLLANALRKETICFKSSIIGILMRGDRGACAHATVIGGILGAIIGYSQLPQDWLNQLPTENKKWLNNKLNLLLDLFGLP